MMRWPAWHHPQGTVALAPLIDYPLRTGKPRHEARQNLRERPRKMTGMSMFDREHEVGVE